jgi:hypothetical protein
MDIDPNEHIRKKLRRSAVERYRAEPSSARSDRTARYCIFASVALLTVGSIIYSGSQVLDDETQLAELTRAREQLAPRLKSAQDQRDALYTLGLDLFQLSQTDPVAKQLVVEFKIQRNPVSPGQTSPTNSSW